MFTDLTSATREYWKKLDAVEAAYKRNELTLEEVDAEVQRLMTELGDARYRVLREFWASLQFSVSSEMRSQPLPPLVYWPICGW